MSPPVVFHPRPYQERLIQLGIDIPHFGIFADCGLGKSVIALSILNELWNRADLGRVVVVAPKRVALHTWPAEIAKWSHTRWMTHQVILGSREDRLDAIKNTAMLNIVSYDHFRWLLEYWGDAMPYDTLVLDELSRMKTASSKRFSLFRFRRKYFKRVLGLGGTPNPNGYLDLWGQLYCLDGGRRLGKQYTRFQKRFFSSDYYGYKFEPHEDTVEIINKRIGDICVTLTKEEYLNLPPIIYNNIEIELPPDVREVYEELKEEYEVMLNNGVSIEAPAAAALSTKLRQISSGFVYDADKVVSNLHEEKLDALESVYEEACGEPLLVAYQFVEEKRMILERFNKRGKRGKKVAVVVDDDPDMIKKWEAGEIPMLVAYPGSAAHGLNLQYGGSMMVWYSTPWDFEHHYQMESRLHRSGQEHPVRIHNIMASNSIEQRVLSTLHSKRDAHDGLMEALKLGKRL